jgi:hypothetical protein
MADKIVHATVTGNLPVFINDVLHLPGEDAFANLDELGVNSLDDKSVVGLEKKSTSAAEVIQPAKIAAVAPHAPDAPNPQGIAPGTQVSGTGRFVTPPVAPGQIETVVQPVGADAPVTQEERKEAAAETKQAGKTQKPSK